jgi:hypothetical protein
MPSRTSRKSELSPSITKSGNGIDLGKRDVEVDMGRKSTPSVTSGGVGITREITNIGGVSVTGGVSVDISPLDLGISYDSTENAVSIAAGAELPGGIIGAAGGVTIDLDTGEVTGGSVGAEALGIGVNVSASKDGGVGVGISFQIPFTPIEIELGFGFPPKKPTPKPSPSPNPSPKPTLPTSVSCLTGQWVVGGVGRAFDNESGSFTTSKFYNGSAYITKICLFGLRVNTYNQTGFNVDELKAPEATAGEWADRAFGKGNWLAQDIEFTGTFGFVGYWYWNGLYPNFTAIKNGGAIKANWKYKRKLYYGKNSTSDQTWWSGGYFLGIEYDYEGTIEEIVPAPSCPTGKPLEVPNNLIFSTPFPNPPPTKRNMDECCRESTKLLREIYKGLGISKFPGKLPATIIQEVPKEGEQPEEPAQVPIEDFVDLLDWQFRRDDERWGQWEVQINVKDADLTEEGDQSKQIKFPNLAESIAELEGQMLSVMANVDALVAITTKNLAESGMARQESIKSYLAAKAIIKYMAFKSTEIDVPVPMTFTPGAETISALIKESEGHIKGTDYVEKETFRDICLDLLQAAAIIRAVHWQKIDSKNDTKTQLLDLLKGTVDLAGLITNPKKGSDGQEKKFDPSQNFEDFIDSVEDGFRNTTGTSDIQNPYGRTPDRRPRIREIGDNLSEAGGNN